MRPFTLVALILASSLLVDCMKYRDPRMRKVNDDDNALDDDNSYSRELNDPASGKGLNYYLSNYGPLVKIIASDFMDSFGVGKNMQMAVPIIMKMVVIGMYSFMQIDPTLLAFQGTVKSSYNFLRSFNSPDLHMVNEITDRVFKVIDEASDIYY